MEKNLNSLTSTISDETHFLVSMPLTIFLEPDKKEWFLAPEPDLRGGIFGYEKIESVDVLFDKKGNSNIVKATFKTREEETAHFLFDMDKIEDPIIFDLIIQGKIEKLDFFFKDIKDKFMTKIQEEQAELKSAYTGDEYELPD
jgi:hypothetical protein